MCADLINVVGAGQLGRSMARLWHRAGTFAIGAVVSRSRPAAQRAIDYIGAGRAATDLRALPPARGYLLAVPDDAIAAVASGLASAAELPAGAVAWHCSGALASAVLEPLRRRGMAVASVHPVCSFADPERIVRDFAGTFVGAEGEAPALALLRPAYAALGARWLDIDPQAKPLYHAAAVIGSNYLVALLDVALQLWQLAGIDRADALQLLRPLAGGALRNLLEKDAAGALSGPIARGDHRVVASQLHALGARDPQLADLYRELGRRALELARSRPGADAAALDAVAAALGDPGQRRPHGGCG